MQSYQNYINGSFTPSSSGKTFDSVNPYTGEVWASVAQSDAADVDKAVAAARNAFDSGWAETKPTERGRLLYKLADLIERDAAHLAEIEVRDNGKLIAEMSGQTHYMPQWYRYYGGLADKVEGAVIPTDKDGIKELKALIRNGGRVVGTTEV